MIFWAFQPRNFLKTNDSRSTVFLHFTKLIIQNNYIWVRLNIIRYWKNVAFDFIKLYWHITCLFSDITGWEVWQAHWSWFLYLTKMLDANTFISSRWNFCKIDSDFNILVLFYFRPVRTYITSIFKCLLGRDITLLIASRLETSRSVKNILPIECYLLLSLP